MDTCQARKHKLLFNFNTYEIMKEIEVGIAERIMLVGVFNQVKGDVETLQAVLEDVKEVSISDAEKEEIGFEEVKGIDPQDGVEKTLSLKWNKTPLKKVTLSEKTVKFILKFIDDKSKAEELTLADNALLEINTKLK